MVAVSRVYQQPAQVEKTSTKSSQRDEYHPIAESHVALMATLQQRVEVATANYAGDAKLFNSAPIVGSTEPTDSL